MEGRRDGGREGETEGRTEGRTERGREGGCEGAGRGREREGGREEGREGMQVRNKEIEQVKTGASAREAGGRVTGDPIRGRRKRDGASCERAGSPGRITPLGRARVGPPVRTGQPGRAGPFGERLVQSHARADGKAAGGGRT